MNKIYDAILNSSAKELEVVASHIWIEFDLKFSEQTEFGHAGETARLGDVLELLLNKAKENEHSS